MAVNYVIYCCFKLKLLKIQFLAKSMFIFVTYSDMYTSGVAVTLIV